MFTDTIEEIRNAELSAASAEEQAYLEAGRTQADAEVEAEELRKSILIDAHAASSAAVASANEEAKRLVEAYISSAEEEIESLRALASSKEDEIIQSIINSLA